MYVSILKLEETKTDAKSAEDLRDALTSVENEIYAFHHKEIRQRQMLEREEALLDRDLELMIERMSTTQWNGSATSKPATNTPLYVIFW